MIDFGMTLEEAIAAPRLSQRNGGSASVDQGFETTALGQALAAYGHQMKQR